MDPQLKCQLKPVLDEVFQQFKFRQLGPRVYLSCRETLPAVVTAQRGCIYQLTKVHQIPIARPFRPDASVTSAPHYLITSSTVATLNWILLLLPMLFKLVHMRYRYIDIRVQAHFPPSFTQRVNEERALFNLNDMLTRHSKSSFHHEQRKLFPGHSATSLCFTSNATILP